MNQATSLILTPDAAILTILGGFVGWLITHIYAKKSSHELKEEFDKLNKQLIKQTDFLSAIELRIRPTDPRIADTIQIAIEKQDYSGVELSIIDESDPCPKCGSKSLHFSRWGNGPLGVCNALYKCTKCNYSFQTRESFSY